MKSFVITGLLLSLGLVGYSHGQDKYVSITVESTKIKVPLPADLIASKDKLKSLANYMKSATPTNEIHEIFASKEATEESLQTSGLKRNADVQTVKTLHNKMTQEIFDGIKDLLTKQFDQLIKEVTKDRSQGDLTIETMEKVGSGPFVDKQDSYCYLFFSTVKSGDKEVQRVSSANICFVNGNMVMLNVHSNLESEKDAEWVKSTSKKWVEATLAANGEN